MTGVSGAGKTSLAFDTLFAEGQRRYVESFAVHSRRRLDALERPDADLIEGVPAAIAVRRHRGTSLGRGTVSTASEVDEHLRLLFARCGELVCPNCNRPVRASTSAEMARSVHELPPVPKCSSASRSMWGERPLLRRGRDLIRSPTTTTGREGGKDAGGQGRGEAATGKPRRSKSDRTKPPASTTDALSASLVLLREAGFQRVLAEGRTVDLRDISSDFVARLVSAETSVRVVVDRVTAGTTPLDRLNDSFELAVSRGMGVRGVSLNRAETTTERSRSTAVRGGSASSRLVANALDVDSRFRNRMLHCSRSWGLKGPAPRAGGPGWPPGSRAIVMAKPPPTNRPSAAPIAKAVAGTLMPSPIAGEACRWPSSVPVRSPVVVTNFNVGSGETREGGSAMEASKTGPPMRTAESTRACHQPPTNKSCCPNWSRDWSCWGNSG